RGALPSRGFVSTAQRLKGGDEVGAGERTDGFPPGGRSGGQTVRLLPPAEAPALSVRARGEGLVVAWKLVLRPPGLCIPFVYRSFFRRGGTHERATIPVPIPSVPQARPPGGATDEVRAAPPARATRGPYRPQRRVPEHRRPGPGSNHQRPGRRRHHQR